MSTTRLTFGTVLSTVTDAATAVSTTLNVVTKSIGMADAQITAMAEAQAIRLKLEQSSTTERLIEETAMADTQRQLGIKEYLDKNPGSSELYQANQKRLADLLNTK